MLEKGLNHKNIVKCIEMFYEKNTPVLVLEYCNGGTLADQLEK